MKKKTTMLGAILLAVLMVMNLFACATPTPIEKVENAIDKNLSVTMDAYEDMGEKAAEALSGGSIEVSGSLEGLLEEALGFSAAIDGAAKLYFGKDSLGLKVSASMNGSEIADLSANVNAERLVLASEALLGGDAYGMAFDTFLAKFDDSVFGPEGSYSLGFSAADVQTIIEEYTKSMTATALDVEAIARFEKNSEKFLNGLKQCFFTSLAENSTVEVAKGSVTAADKSIETEDISFKLDGMQLLELAEDVVKYFQNNESLDAILTELDKVLAEEEALEGTSLREMLEQELDIEYLLEEIADAKTEYTESGETVTAQLVCHISKSEKTLVGIDLDIIGEDSDVTLAFVIGPSVKDMKSLDAAIINRIDGEEDARMELHFAITEDTKNAYSAKLELVSKEMFVGEEFTEGYTFTLDWNKAEGDLTVAAFDEDGETLFAFIGSLLTDKEKTVFTADRIEVEYDSLELGGLRVTVTYKDTMPEIGEYNELLDMTEDDLNGVLISLLGVLGSVVS